MAYILYILLTWIPDRQELIAGFFVALVVAVLFGQVFTVTPKKLFNPKRYFYFLLYLPVFIYYCFKANIDVAYRVLHPKMPINPGIVKIKTNLKNDVARTMLANSITLTPGTMTVDIIGDTLYIHWINVQAKETEKATRLIVGSFEKLIKEVFE